jgi:hypothetical protein
LLKRMRQNLQILRNLCFFFSYRHMGPTSTTNEFFWKKFPHFAKFFFLMSKDNQISTLGPIHSHNIEGFKKNSIVKPTLSPNLEENFWYGYITKLKK